MQLFESKGTGSGKGGKDAQGKEGSIDYFPLGLALVVNETPQQKGADKKVDGPSAGAVLDKAKVIENASKVAGVAGKAAKVEVPTIPSNPGAGALGLVPGDVGRAANIATATGITEVHKNTVAKVPDQLAGALGGGKSSDGWRSMGYTKANDGGWMGLGRDTRITFEANGKTQKVPMTLPGGKSDMSVEIQTDGRYIKAVGGGHEWILGSNPLEWTWNKVK